MPDHLLQENYTIDELDRETNTDFPLDMTMIREKQDQDQKLQELVHCKDMSILLTSL